MNRRESGRGLVPQAAVRPLFIVRSSPVFHDELGLRQRAKRFAIEQLVTQTAVERLDKTILPRTARLDVQRRGAGVLEPMLNRIGDELTAVVAAQMLRPRAALLEQPCQRLDHDLCRDRSLDADQQASVLTALLEEPLGDTEPLLAPLVRDLRAPGELTPATQPDGSGNEASSAPAPPAQL